MTFPAESVLRRDERSVEIWRPPALSTKPLIVEEAAVALIAVVCMPPPKVLVAVDVAVNVPTVRLPIVEEAEAKSVEVAEVVRTEFGKITEFGNESVHVRSALRSWAPALEVIWLAVPAMVRLRVVGMSAVKVVPPRVMEVVAVSVPTVACPIVPLAMRACGKARSDEVDCASAPQAVDAVNGYAKFV
jgi:hypothetical protein